jgi:hypothetical protein
MPAKRIRDPRRRSVKRLYAIVEGARVGTTTFPTITNKVRVELVERSIERR